MRQCSHRILFDKGEIGFSFRGEFSGLEAFEHIHNALPSDDCLHRVALDFSGASRVKPIEILYLLENLKDDPCFNNMEIQVKGLRYSCMDVGCPKACKENREIQQHAVSFD
jgi:hypothetical protein